MTFDEPKMKLERPMESSNSNTYHGFYIHAKQSFEAHHIELLSNYDAG